VLPDQVFYEHMQARCPITFPGSLSSILKEVLFLYRTVLFAIFWFTFLLLLFWCKDVAQERTQQALIKGVEDFDTKKLKHTNTVEKIVLPDKEGMRLVAFISIAHTTLRSF
jgi:Thymosin beta-4 family